MPFYDVKLRRVVAQEATANVWAPHEDAAREAVLALIDEEPDLAWNDTSEVDILAIRDEDLVETGRDERDFDDPDD